MDHGNIKPTEKADVIDIFIKKTLGIDRKKHIEDRICPFCKKKVDINSFVDELSLKEYRISGICQQCQDEFFI